MKPTLPTMDEKSTNVAVVMQPTDVQENSGTSKKSNKRLVTGIVSGIIVLLIVVAAVLIAVFIGAKVTQEARKEAWINFKDKDGQAKSEHVVVTDREEDYTIPNSMRVIYDFDKGYAVHKFEQSSKSGSDSNVCYVSHLNRTNMATPKQMKEEIAGNEIELPTKPSDGERRYKSTGQEFDRTLLLPRAKEMCKDSKVVWMAETKDDDMKQKRDCAWSYVCDYYLVYYYGDWYIVQHCYYVELCD